jgi:hypothetical protein
METFRAFAGLQSIDHASVGRDLRRSPLGRLLLQALITFAVQWTWSF